jgi:HK97 gp10 family phage protein
MGDVVLFEAPLRRLLDTGNSQVARHLTRLALTVQNEARRRAPVDTGRLRSSITFTLDTDRRGLVARVGTNVDYAAHVEFGTRHSRAQPYLRPALDTVRR